MFNCVIFLTVFKLYYRHNVVIIKMLPVDGGSRCYHNLCNSSFFRISVYPDADYVILMHIYKC